MDTITLARELGRAIQQEESYKKLHEVQAQADADAELQALIGEFNLKRMNINQEASKKDRDQDKLTTLNKEMREVYSKIPRCTNVTQATIGWISVAVQGNNATRVAKYNHVFVVDDAVAINICILQITRLYSTAKP